MEPFSIQCQTCQARLKVTKPTLLGKRLPCPKCQSTVVIPETHQHATEDNPNAASTAGDVPADEESLGGFEDVDDLLSQLPEEPSPPTKPRQTPHRKTRPEPTKSEDAASTTASEPIASELSWDNPAVAKTRRTLALAATATGVILIAAIGSYAWLSSPAADPIAQAAAKDTTSNEPAPPDLLTDSATTDNSSPDQEDKGAAISEQTDSEPGEASFADAISEKPDAATNNQPIVSSTPPPIDMIEPPTAVDMIEPPTAVESGAGSSMTSPAVKPATTKSRGKTGSAPTPKPTQDSTSTSDQILQPVAPASSALGELSALLEESGSSISAINDATASVAATDTIGLPKYYFQASRSAPVDINRQLEQPCAGLRYQNVPMIEILRDVTVISGIPISVEFPSLIDKKRAGDERLLSSLGVDVADTDFREAIETIAQTAGRTSTITEAGVFLTDSQATSLLSQTIDLSPISILGDEGLDGVVDSIRAMIAADSWFSNAQTFQLKRNGMSLKVQHFPPVVRQVERFIDKLSAAIQLVQPDITNRDSLKKSLTTRLSLAASNLSASCELEITARSTLDDLLNRIREKTGVDVVANWQTLAALEWTPQMTVPGNVSELTLDKMLRQMERSLDATAIVLDANTIELTHPTDALRRGYVEFYLISDLFDQNFTPQRAIQLVQEAIENAGQPAAMTIYDPRCECIILAAPQSTHRVVEVVLQELRQLE